MSIKIISNDKKRTKIRNKEAIEIRKRKQSLNVNLGRYKLFKIRQEVNAVFAAHVPEKAGDTRS